MKRLKRKILNSAGFRFALSFVIAFYIRFVLLTSRKVFIFPEESKCFFSGEKQAIAAFWHGRLLMMPHLRAPSRKMHVLISSHRDGLIISQTMDRFDVHTIVGSSSKGSLGALKNIFIALKEGDNVVITPDGPKGPFQVAATGVAHIVARCDVPVVPMAFSSTRHLRMKSWDRFMVALPFSTLYFAAGLPIHGVVGSSKETVELLRARIEIALSEITAEADRRAGVV